MTEKVLKRIRLERFNNGFSQAYVASKLEISQSFYARIESGKNNLSEELLNKLTKLFNIPAEELLK